MSACYCYLLELENNEKFNVVQTYYVFVVSYHNWTPIPMIYTFQLWYIDVANYVLKAPLHFPLTFGEFVILYGSSQAHPILITSLRALMLHPINLVTPFSSPILFNGFGKKLWANWLHSDMWVLCAHFSNWKYRSKWCMARFGFKTHISTKLDH